MMDPLDINGEPPDLQGATLQELLVSSFWFAGELAEEANVVYLKADDVWHRLYFDCGIIFWRPETGPPESYDFRNDDGTLSDVRVVDLGRDRNLVVGSRIDAYTMEPVDGGSRVQFRMSDATCVGFENLNDNTRIMTQQSPGGDSLKAAPQE